MDELDLELDVKLAGARRGTAVAWSPQRQDAAARGLQQRVRRRGQRRAAIATVAMVAATGGLVAGLLRHSDDSAWREAHHQTGAVLPTGGESLVVVEREDTVLARHDDDDGSVTVDLGAGAARFEERSRRHLTVKAGPVRVDVTAAVFRVERVMAGARITVERGGARVSWPGGTSFVPEGGDGVFPPPPVAAPLPGSDRAAPAPAEPPAEPPAVRGPRAAAGNGAAALMAAADAARSGGDEARAAELLARLVQSHPTDERAPLAAFARGRILLEKLGRARAAAEAFHTARRLAPRGPLAEDALAREAEALTRAGVTAEAAARLAEYRRLYPGGRWLSVLERVGGSSP